MSVFIRSTIEERRSTAVHIYTVVVRIRSTGVLTFRKLWSAVIAGIDKRVLWCVDSSQPIAVRKKEDDCHDICISTSCVEIGKRVIKTRLSSTFSNDVISVL